MLKPIRRIGASKLATVSECLTVDGKHVALKQFDRQILSSLQHERIFSSAERWRKLSCPGLLTYLAVLPKENEIVMELMDRSALTRLQEGPSDPRLVLHTLRDVLSALAYLHAQALIHVNVKPANVFFDADGRARLSDGLLVPAKAPGVLPPPSNQKYLTPEHTSDALGPLSPATDLYQAGFLALELLAGERFARAFQGVDDAADSDDIAWFQWHASSQEAPAASSFCKTCPADLTAVIARLVSKNPKARFASARDALQVLPLDISPQTVPAAGATATVEPKRQALATDVLERPATGIVMAIASGPRAGEMIGTNETEFYVGFDHDCFIRFSGDQYPNEHTKVLLRRGPQGWYALRVAGDSAFINQRQLGEKLTLRSGDIVRLSAQGPDVQFTMQSGGLAIRTLVDRFLPAQSARPSRGRGTAPVGDERGGRTPLGPAAAGRAASSSSSESADAPGRRKAAAFAPSLAKSPQGESAQAAAKPQAAPQLQKKPAAVSLDTPMFGSKAAGASEAKRNTKFSQAAGGRLISPNTWSRNQTKLAVAVVAGLLVLLIVFLFSTWNPNPSENQIAPTNPETESAQNAASPPGAQASESGVATTAPTSPE